MIKEILITGALIALIIAPTTLDLFGKFVWGMDTSNQTTLGNLLPEGNKIIKGLAILFYESTLFFKNLYGNITFTTAIILLLCLFVISRFGPGMIKGTIIVAIAWQERKNFWKWLKRRSKIGR